MTIESYIIGLICCLLNLRNMDSDGAAAPADKWTKANSVLTYILLVYFILFPVVALYKMHANFD